MEQNHFPITPVPVETDGISVHAVQSLFYTLLWFWIDKAVCPQNQLLLGFGAIPLTQLPDAMKRLAEVIKNM